MFEGIFAQNGDDFLKELHDFLKEFCMKFVEESLNEFLKINPKVFP